MKFKITMTTLRLPKNLRVHKVCVYDRFFSVWSLAICDPISVHIIFPAVKDSEGGGRIKRRAVRLLLLWGLVIEIVLFFESFDTANIYIALNGAKHNVSPFSGFIFWLRLLPHFQQQKIPVAGIFNYCVENINPESLKHRPTKMANKYCGTVFVCVFFF